MFNSHLTRLLGFILLLSNIASAHASLESADSIEEAMSSGKKSLVLRPSYVEKPEFEWEQLSGCTHLKKLFLKGFKITRCTEQVFDLTGLTSLTIAETGIEVLPDAIKRLKNLENLSVRDAKLSFVPDLSKLTALETCEISGNRIVAFKNNGKLPGNLKKLSLGGNEITVCDLSVMNSFDPSISSLNELNLRCNLLTCVPRFGVKMENLKEVALARNMITTIPANWLERLPNCTRLDLSYNHFAELPHEIRAVTKLEELYLEGCENLETLPSSLAFIKGLKFIEVRRAKLSMSAKSAVEELNKGPFATLVSTQQMDLLLTLSCLLNVNRVWVQGLDSEVLDFIDKRKKEDN